MKKLRVFFLALLLGVVSAEAALHSPGQPAAAGGGGSGTVTSVTCGTGLTGGTFTTSGTCATAYGTTASTSAAGNDSRITGALQAASDLSDVGTPATARTNLGLGTMATQAASAVAITGGTINGVSQSLLGTTTNNNAAAGIVGEYVESRVAVVSGVALTTTVAANVTSISLTAGDWDVSGQVNLVGTAATTTVTNQKIGAISLTSATLPTDGSAGYAAAVSTAAGFLCSISPAIARVSVAGTTTVYLVTSAAFTAGTVTAFGQINARRVR